jgi:hypothetical protein
MLSSRPGWGGFKSQKLFCPAGMLPAPVNQDELTEEDIKNAE